jgi:hypothetical protein
MGITDKAMKEALSLIIGGGKAATGAAKGAPKAVKPKLPKVKPRITDAEIDDILAQGGLTRQDLRTRYPEIGDPVPTTDPKTGKAYMAKGASREAEAVAKVRKRLNEEIKRGDYDRAYDTSARYDANPSYYNRPDVTKDIVPVRPDTRAKYDALYAGPETAKRLDDAIAAAINYPDAHGFYKMGQVQDDYIAAFGPVDGPRLFQEQVMDAMAATTGGADPGSNLLMAAYGNYLKRAPLNRAGGANTPPVEFPTAANQLPYPIGGRFAMGNMKMYDKMLGVTGEGTGVTPANPKRYDFSSAYGGFPDRPVVDEQMMKAIDPTSEGVPSANAYGVARGAISDAATRAGLSPIGGQEVGWAGIKKSKGKPQIEWMNEMLYRTARLTGRSLDEVKRAYMEGRPMFGLAGAGAGAGLLGMTPEEAAAAEIDQYLQGKKK